MRGKWAEKQETLKEKREGPLNFKGEIRAFKLGERMPRPTVVFVNIRKKLWRRGWKRSDRLSAFARG